MDVPDSNIDFQKLPIITLGDDLPEILGINSTDSSIFTDILLGNKNKKNELDDEIKDILNEATETFSTAKHELLETKNTVTETFVLENKIVFSETKDILDVAEIIAPVTERRVDAPKEQLASDPEFSPTCKPLNLAIEYESLARSILVPSPIPPADDSKKFSCSICWKSFPDRRYLNRHFSKHTNRFTCPHCQRVRRVSLAYNVSSFGSSI
jgi:hypothetical protein